MSDTAQRLCRIAASAAAGDALCEDGPWLAGVIQKLFAGTPFEAASGLESGWWRDEIYASREADMFALANDICPGGGFAEQEAALRAALYRYRDGRWKRIDRQRGSMPASYVGKPDALLFSILRKSSLLAGAGELSIPVSTTHMRKVLSRCCA
jgi:hypothetical protein